MSGIPLDFPKYAPLTSAGPEYDGNPLNNPFSGSNLTNYFSQEFLTEYEKNKGTLNKTASMKYRERLIEVANGFITGDAKYLNAVSPLVTNINPIHPFLEPSGAIRVQVPLPQSMDELFILCDQILGNKTTNPGKNLDKYKLTPKGLADPGFPFPWVNMEKERHYLKNGEKPYNRGLMIWDDPSGYAGINPDIRFPNLTLLLLSIMFQQTDIEAYGARGRYGDPTLKRLLDGHGVQCDDSTPSHRMLHFLIFNADSGMPMGYISAAVYKTKMTISDKETEINTIFNHYAFVPKTSLAFSDELKITEVLYIYMLGYVATYITGAPLAEHFVVAHSDKSPAVKAACKVGKYFSENAAIYKKIADDAFDAIMVLKDQEKPFKLPASVEGFPQIQFYDQSTVPRDDPGEEVPVAGERFYTNVYKNYVDVVRKLYPGVDIPDRLRNGKLEDKHLPALRKIAVNYGYEDEETLLKWMKSWGSFINGKDMLSLIDKDGYVQDGFPINDRKQLHAINTVSLLDTPINKDDPYLLKFRRLILEFLIQVAKDGNTGNREYGKMPRLTDFAYMMTYQIPVGNDSPIHWGVTYATRSLIKSFSLSKENHDKVKFLGKAAQALHNNYCTIGEAVIMTAAFDSALLGWGAWKAFLRFLKPSKL